MKTLGMRHIALNVRDAQASKAFYCKVLKMQVEWEPDPKSIYLTSLDEDGPGLDNIALHQADAPLHKPGFLNHIGFFVPTKEDVAEWYEHIKNSGAKIVKEMKDHRDGARSFYFEDPDGIIIQLLYHIPVVKRVPLQMDDESYTK
jgi:catechol 2,3-dioxygenase-like lactoylglutathione lyase family enzyme